jgi:transposase
MTLLPRGVKVHLAFGYIDMRKGIDGLAMLVQGVLRQDPFSGHLFVFRVRRPISSRSYIGTAPAFASSPNGSSTACSCGRRTSNLT